MFGQHLSPNMRCLDHCNNSIILRKAFGPNEYLNSPKKHVKKRRFWTIKLNTLDMNEILGSDLEKRSQNRALEHFHHY